MDTSIVTIFQSFGFPTALSVALLAAFGWLGKKTLNNMKENNAEAVKLRDQYIQYLQDNHKYMQQNHIDLTAAVMESASAMKENAQALNRFSMVLDKIETKLNIIKNKQNDKED